MTVDERIEMDWLTGKRKGHGMRYRRKGTVEAIQYQGFDVNGRECEIFAGGFFETHLPSKNMMELTGSYPLHVGDWLVRDGGSVRSRSRAVFEATYEPVGDTDVR